MDPHIVHGGTAPAPHLLDQVRDTIRRRHYSYCTEEACVHSIRRDILFHNKRHPRDMAAPEVTAFLNHLARDRDVAASTQTRRCPRSCFSTRMCWRYRSWLDDLERAQRPPVLRRC
jgi:hypothetical protein